MRSTSPGSQRAVRHPFTIIAGGCSRITTTMETIRKENFPMRKLTTIVAFVLTLSIAAPVATYAANPSSPKTKSSTVREDRGSRDQDPISRFIQFIKAHLPINSNDDAPLPTIPNP